MGLGTGLIALCWLAWSEWLLGPWDSWMFLNRNRTEPVWEFGFMYIKILAVALAVFATAVAILRLLPPGIRLRKAPLRQRTCPAAALGLAVLAAWFAHAVTPYEVPVCMKSSGPDDADVFGYHFEGSAGRGFIPSELTAALAHSPDLLPRHTPPAKPLLRSWNGEAWYVIVDRRRLLVFTSENGAQPPESITAFVREAENIPLERVQKGALRDACLGFCSDPLSEMGYPEGRNEREALLLRSQ